VQHAETIVVQATERLLDGGFKRFGVAGASELFDAREHFVISNSNGDLFKE